jgi:hypothetical protein
MLRNIFGPKGKAVTGAWRKLHKKEGISSLGEELLAH